MQNETERNREYAVVIAGAGPTGLMLAAELALARVEVVVVERRETQELSGSRAGGLHPRTLELLDQRGVVERFVAQGQKYEVAPFADGMLAAGDLPTRHSYWLALWQNEIERTLAAWVQELGVPILRGRHVTRTVQDDHGVDLQLADGGTLRARYLVGCDGGRSAIRKQAGIEFPGWDATTSYLIAEATPAQEPAWGLRRGERGVQALAKLDGGKRMRMVLCESSLRQGDEPTLEDLRAALITAFGSDYGVHDATWISRFTDMARQAASYRAGRVLLAGDAAHVHSPAGGQGLNIGVQDAVNLGWKLAQVVHGTCPATLLDSYHAERHPVGARLLRNTMAWTALERGDERSAALRAMLSELMQVDDARKRYLAMKSGLDVHYELGEGHPLLGRRMPDLQLHDGQRVFALLHEARPLLLELDAALDIKPWSHRVSRVEARYDGSWELPVCGEVPAPKAVLIRPDGYVAWVGSGTGEGLHDALTTWFGPAAPPSAV